VQICDADLLILIHLFFYLMIQ